MKLADLKKQSQTRPNLAAKHSQSSGAGTHKSPKDYERKEKHPKDLRRTDEDWTDGYKHETNIDKVFNDERDADDLIEYLKDVRKFAFTQKLPHKGRWRVRGILKGMTTPVKEGAVPQKIITITMGVRGDAEQKVAKLLHNISNVCSMGCSRGWGIVDGDRGESVHTVDFDGDGADALIDVKIDGKSVKGYTK